MIDVKGYRETGHTKTAVAMILTFFATFLLACGVDSNNVRHRHKLHREHDNNLFEHDSIFMKEIPIKSMRRDYESNLANGMAAEREILMEFYDTTNGPHWYDSPGNNWGRSDVNHCYNWTHVECDDEGRVVKIPLTKIIRAATCRACWGGWLRSTI